jgi:hypothetical protein
MSHRFASWATALLLATAALPAAASCVTDHHGQTRCPPPDSQCLMDLHGEWRCSPSGGGVVYDRSRTPVCGAGACVTDVNGNVMCSVQSRGSAALDRYSQAVCTGGCVAASAQSCSALTR